MDHPWAVLPPFPAAPHSVGLAGQRPAPSGPGASLPTCSAAAGPRLLTAAKDRLAVRVWSETESGPGWVLEAEWRCGPAEVTFGPRFCWITGLVVCASGRWAAASRYDGQVDLFWLEEDESSSTHRITDHPIVCLAVARGYLVTGHFDGSVNLVHIAGRDRGVVGIATLLPSQQCAALYSACVRAVCADGAGRTLFTAGLDNRVRVWEWDRDATAWTQTDLLAGTEVSQGILALACLDEGNTTYLAAGCTVGVLTWTRESRGQGGWVRTGAGSRDGEGSRGTLQNVRATIDWVDFVGPPCRLATAGPRSGLRVWDIVGDGSLLSQLGPPPPLRLARLPPAPSRPEAVQFVRDAAQATGLLPDVAALVYDFLYPEGRRGAHELLAAQVYDEGY